MEKEETERFKDYLSPIKLSVYTSVIVSILLMDYGGEQNFVSRIKGVSMVEKALFIFLINNFTAVLFSVVLLWYKREKVNTTTFRTLLFSFIYTTVYTSTPAFLFTFSMMFLGQTANVDEYIQHLNLAASVGIKECLFLVICLVTIAIGGLGVIKLVRALHHILKENFRYHPYIVWFFTLLFFAIQVLYTMEFVG
ncbi:hypothetical protein OZ664_18720 [Elizabethkingia sp. HX WHF]|nr:MULTISPECIES: hypothetical protein [Elizabethkingia]MCL1637899.1 hypothetical protein [Elizabethkingia bruuniana]MDX8566047.1 hypothetical protein [Elizabethkingia sp. HX WHF]